MSSAADPALLRRALAAKSPAGDVPVGRWCRDRSPAGRIVFGVWEPRTGAVGSRWDVVRARRLLHRPEVRGGALEDECAELVDGFSRSSRARAVSGRGACLPWNSTDRKV